MAISGDGIPAGATVASVTNSTTFVLSVAANFTGSSNLTATSGVITLSTPTTGTSAATLVAASTALTFTAPNQSLTVTTLNYNGAASVQLVKGSATTSTLTATALARGTNGMLTVVSSNLSTDLGANEKFLTGTAQTNANNMLAVPTIVGRSSTSQDLNFLKYDVTNGFILNTTTTVGTINGGLATDATKLAEIIATGATAAAGINNVYALRTQGDIAAGGATAGDVIGIGSGGLIMNASSVNGNAPTIAANLAFGTVAAGPVITPTEALVWVSGGQTGASTISGNITATDFTKAGTGTLLLSGTGNVLAPTTTALRNLNIQEGTVRFGSNAAVPSGGLINIAVNNAGVFDVNGQNLSIGGLTGTGSVNNSGSSSTLTVNTGVGQSTTFTGTINGNLNLVKAGDGTLTLNQPLYRDGAPLANTYTGTTTINAGRVTSANIVAPVSTGTLAVRNTLALGSGAINIKGGILDLSATSASGYALGEVIDNVSVVQFGPGNGYNLTIDQFNSFGNGATYANTTSTLTAGGTPLGWSLINHVTLNAPALTFNSTSNLGVMINGVLTVNQDATLNTLFTTTSNANSAFISGRISASGRTLTKTGAGTLFLSNGDAGVGANDVGAWKLMAGITDVRLSNNASDPFGSAAPITLNGATLLIRHEGDNTANMQVLNTFAGNNLTIGSTAGIGGGSYIGSGAVALTQDRSGSGSNKTVQFGSLAFGGPLGSPVLTIANNQDNLQLSASFSSLSMTKDALLTNNSRTGGNGNVTIYGNISGNGTLVKGGGGGLFVNSDNMATFKGGYVQTAGTTIFGTYEGNVTTLSNTANLGTGNTLIQPGAAIQFNSTGNLAAGAGTVDLRSNALGNYGILRMAANEPLSSFNMLVGNLGGPQDTSYFGLAGGNGFNGGGKNAGSAIIALNTVYTQALDLAKIGDGTAFLGSTQNGLLQNGSYNAATLGVGAGKTYRLGAGSQTLYISSDLANNNVLTGLNANLIVGMPHSGLNADSITTGNGRGTVVLMTSNDYTGSTVVNRGSILEFRGSLLTSSFGTWGTLTAGGLGGTFTNAAGTAALAPVTLRNSSEVRFDYSTGLLATNRLEGWGAGQQGRWDDDTAIVLNNSTIRLIGNRDVEVTETVGDVTVGKFGQLAVQRDLLDRTVTLVVGGGAGTDITRQTQTNNTLAISGNAASLQINPANGAQLGSDERIKLFSGTGANGLTALGGITNGMVAPWIVNGTDLQFLTYTADNGFVNAGFDGSRGGNIGGTGGSAILNVPTERTLLSSNLVFNAAAQGTALDSYAIRLDGDVTFANNITAAAADIIRTQSGGMIANGIRNVISGISFGASAQEANIFNSGTFTIGSTLTQTATTALPGLSPTLTGQITNATNIVKHGAGTLQIDAAQGSFSGNWIVNQGSIAFRSAIVQSNLGGTATLAQMNVGTNGLVVINNFGGQLNLREDVTNVIFNLGLAIGEGNPYAVLNADRSVGNTGTGFNAQMTGGIRFGGSPGEQGQTLYINNVGNGFTLQVNGPLVLSAATMEGSPAYNFIRTDVDATINGIVTGGAALIHTGSSTLTLGNGNTGFLNGINTFTGGLQNVQGAITVRGTTTGTPANFATLFSGINNGGIGGGDVTMYSGTLNLRIDGANTTTRERYVVGNVASGNNLIINGSSTVDVNRNIAASATNKHLAFKDLTIGSSTLTVSGGNTYALEINGSTNLTGTPLLNVSTAPLLLNGVINDGAGFAAGTIGQAIIKGGADTLWLNSPTSTFGGLYAGTTSTNGLGIVVNGGLLRFGDINSENATPMNLGNILRNSTIRINPNGGLLVSNPVNAVFAPGQVEMLSTGPQMSIFRMNAATFTQTYLQNALSSNSSGVLAMNASLANPLNLGAIGNGQSFLGATAASLTYSAVSLGVGAGNTYRLSGGGQTLTLNSTALGNAGALVEGTAGTRVLIGSQAGNVTGGIDSYDLFTYTGGTVISRSNSLVVRENSTLTAGPLGLGGAVDIFGTLQVYGNATLRNVAGNANAYAVNLHPGSVLWLDNDGTNLTNRWDDGTAINLNGGQLYLRARNDAAVTSTETVGAINYSMGSSLRVDKRIAAGAAELTVGALTRGGTGSTLLIIPATAGNLGVAGNDNAERVVVTGGETAITPNGVVNGMLPAYIVNGTDNTFLTYGANGFANATYDNTFIGGVFTTNTTGTSKVDIGTAFMVLTQDQTVYALRTSQNISSGVGQYNTITFADGTSNADRGGLITTGTPTIATNLKFGTNGNKEGIIYNTGNTTLSGDLYAGSLTKFGAGTLIIGKDQTAAANGTGFGGNWVVNQGGLTLNTFGASGDGGTITLNSSSPTTASGTTLTLAAAPGSSLNGQYTMGRIIAVDNAILTATPGVTDSGVSISELEINSTDTTGLSPARLRVNLSNTRSVLNAGTLYFSGAGNSIVDVTTVTNNQITSGATGSGLNVAGLNGSKDLIKWGNGYLWVGGNNSTSYTGDVFIQQGAIGVTNANAFANAGTSITASRYGVLDILTTGFNKTVTYEAGAIERWSVDNARSGTINLGAGSLQVNADQNTTTATIQINGGAIEGFLRTDDVSSSNSGLVFRTLGSGVSVQLLGNSFVGQNAFTDGPNGTDNGRTTDLTTGIGPDGNNNSELQANARGAILEIKGNISGVGGLTKQSADTVILSGTNTYSGSTNIANGTLRLGSANALPSGNNVTTSSRGVLDLGGYNASIGNLNTPVNTGAVFASSQGFITNSATEMRALTVTPTATSSYGGVIQNNVALTKAGSQKLTLTNANTYTGATTVSGGILELTHVTAAGGVIDAISGTSSLTVSNGATFNLRTGINANEILTLVPTTGTVLSLTGTNRIGIEVGTGSVSSQIALNSGALAFHSGTTSIDVYGITGSAPGGTHTVISAPSGGLLTSNGSSGSYVLGNVYNNFNFTVTGVNAADTLVTLGTAAGSLTNAFWKGGFSGGNNVWAISDGTTLSNWATNLGGTDTGLVPGSTTNVFLSATSASNQGSMVLGSSMSIGSLTLNSTSGTPVVLNNDGGYSLSISGGTAITSDVSSGAATFNTPIALSNATPTIAVNSANPLTLAGTVSGAATSLTKSGTGTLVLNGANAHAGTTLVTAGILSITNGNALGAAAASAGTGTVVSAGATLQLSNNISVNALELLTLNGTGAGSNGALRNLSGTNFYGGLITLGSATTIQSDAGTLTLANPGTILGATFGLTVAGAGNTVIDSIIGTTSGTLTKSGTGVLTLNGANTFTGKTIIGNGALSVASLNSVTGGTATSNLGAPTTGANGTIDLGATTTAGTLIYTGTGQTTDRVINLAGTTGGGVIDQSGTGLLKFTSALTATGAGIKTLTLQGSTAGTGEISAAIVNNSGTNTTGLIKTGSGTWTLSGTNTYSGQTAINGGILSVATSANLGSASATNTLAMNGGTLQTTATLNLGATRTLSLGASGGTIDVATSTIVTLPGVISGTGGLSKAGAGTLTVTDANTFSGKTTIANGTLSIASIDAVASNAQPLGTNAALDLGVASTYSGRLLYTGAATTLSKDINALGNGSDTIQNGGSGLLTLSGTLTKAGTTLNLVGGASGILVTGTIVGLPASSDLVIGNGVTTLQNANTYNGPTILNSGGTLNINHANAISTGTLTINGGTLDNTSGAPITLTTNNPLNITSNFTFTGTNSLNLGTGAVTLDANRSVTVTANTLTIGGAISGAFSLTGTGAGTLVLTGDSSYTGTTTAVAGSTISVGGNGSLGDTSSGTVVDSGASLALNNVLYTDAEALTINGTGVGSSGAFRTTGTSSFAGTITAATDATINATGTLSLTGGLVKNGTTLTLGGTGTYNISSVGISGASANSDLVVDAATVNLDVASTYNGPTFIRNGGRINANVANALPTSISRTAIVMDDSGSGSSTLGLAANQSVASLMGVATSQILLGASQLTVGASGASSSAFAGSITGTGGSIVKDGTNTQTFSGASTYTGTTTVSGGTLLVNNATGSGTGTSAVAVNSTATLGGNGAISGNVSVNAGGILAPGSAANTAGTLTLSGANITLAGGVAETRLAFDFTEATGNVGASVLLGGESWWSSYNGSLLTGTNGKANDLVSFTAATTNLDWDTGGRVVLNQLGVTPYTWMLGDVINLLDWTSLSTTGSTFDPTNASNFDLPALSSGLTWDTTRFLATGAAAVTPEPSRMLLLMLGLMGLFFRRRRSRVG